MEKSINIKRLMRSPYPSLTEQKKKYFRPSKRQVNAIYDAINEQIFWGQLKRPEIILTRTRGYWGCCYSHLDGKNPKCSIVLTDKWISVHWLIMILAHEMVHQFENDIDHMKMTHHRTFFLWKARLEKFNIPLKRRYSQRLWFETQNIWKC